MWDTGTNALHGSDHDTIFKPNWHCVWRAPGWRGLNGTGNGAVLGVGETEAIFLRGRVAAANSKKSVGASRWAPIARERSRSDLSAPGRNH